MSAFSWLKALIGTHSFPLLFMVLSSAAAQGQSPLYPVLPTLPIGAVSTPAVGDFNNDGQPDLIYSPPSIPTGSNQFAALTVLLNQGTGTNPTPVVTDSLTCTSVTSLLVADMNKDQKQDVVLTCTEGFVALLFGNGDGTFQASQLQQSPSTCAAVIADVNHDGISDVAFLADPSAAGAPQTIQTLLGSSSGQFTIGTSLSLDPSINYTSLVLAGSTNHGANLDLALGGPATTVLLGDGDGGFSFGQTYAISGSALISGSVLQEAGSNGNTNLVFFTADGDGLDAIGSSRIRQTRPTTSCILSAFS